MAAIRIRVIVLPAEWAEMETPRTVSVGLSYMYEPAFNRAVLPLLEAGEVDALEWSYDTVNDYRLLPDWQRSLLRAYADAGRLYGHGVYFSLINGSWSGRERDALQRLAVIQTEFPFRHLSEHFGFMSSGDAHRGCPLPLPLTAATLLTGQQRLGALASLAGCPVGVENLALAFSREDVLTHGGFLARLVEPVDGFVVLDLHNLYCQSHNFGIGMPELIRSYPLDRVREIHVSGGSWAKAASGSREIRRDTHDERVPNEVMAQLHFAVSHCPNLDVVFLERLGDTLADEADGDAFRHEFLKLKRIVADACQGRAVPPWPFEATWPLVDAAATHPDLLRQQQSILRALAVSGSAPEAKAALEAEPMLADWRIHDWDLDMLDTAMQLGRRWGISLDSNAALPGL